MSSQLFNPLLTLLKKLEHLAQRTELEIYSKAMKGFFLIKGQLLWITPKWKVGDGEYPKIVIFESYLHYLFGTVWLRKITYLSELSVVILKV